MGPLVCGTGRGYCMSAGTANAAAGPLMVMASAAMIVAAVRRWVLMAELLWVVGERGRPSAVPVERR